MDPSRPAGNAPTLSAAQFLHYLGDSRVLSSEALQQLVDHAQGDGKLLALELVKQGKLTPYQASMIYQGKTRGLVLGRYTILEKLGAGGMGMVYRAEQRSIGRTVAVKVLAPGVSKNPVAVQRFQREVQAAAQFTHANIVRAYDADQADGIAFLVMEYVDGTDLSRLVKANGPLPPLQAAALIAQAARGLAHAHASGIIHRDIKPGNLLLDRKGTVKILDMGLARFDEEPPPGSDELTKTGIIMGTADFMAPEQAANSRKADQRADVYSLGATLYYLVAGKAPYTGETAMEKILAHREEPIPPLPGAPAGLQAFYTRMVAKKPADRPQSMAEVAAALEQCGAAGFSGADLATRFTAADQASPALNFSETSPDIGISTRITFPKGRLRWLALGSGVASVLLLGVAVLWLTRSGAAIAKAAPTKPAATEATPALGAIWLDDDTPPGAVLQFDGGDDWTWVSSDPKPFSGSRAHQSGLAAGPHQHYFISNGTAWRVGTGDKLYVHVFLDPANPPVTVMVQWHDSTGSWEHRAYWGAKEIVFGEEGTPTKRSMGKLPPTGKWVRLEVPAALVGLEGMTVDGMAFTLFDGRATWDQAGVTYARPRVSDK